MKNHIFKIFHKHYKTRYKNNKSFTSESSFGKRCYDLQVKLTYLKTNRSSFFIDQMISYIEVLESFSA